MDEFGMMSAGLAPLSVTSVAMLPAMAMSFATSTAFWGTVAHSLGMLPEEAFIQAENVGITLPPMPQR